MARHQTSTHNFTSAKGKNFPQLSFSNFASNVFISTTPVLPAMSAVNWLITLRPLALVFPHHLSWVSHPIQWVVGVFLEVILHPEGHKRGCKLHENIAPNYMYSQFNFLLARSKTCLSLKCQVTNCDRDIRVERDDLERLHLKYLAFAKFRNTHDHVNTLVRPLAEPSLDCWRLATSVE